MDHLDTDLAQINHEHAIARYFGLDCSQLGQSRLTGELFGVKAPKHFTIGKVTFYRKTDIDNWLAQFADQQAEGM
jgi:hypothetical protein